MTHSGHRIFSRWSADDGWFVASVEDAETRGQGPCILSPLTANMNPRLADMACAMPVGDVNGGLLEALVGADGKTRIIAGVLANDPFRRPADLLDGLSKAGVNAVCNWPSVGLLNGELAAALNHSGFTYQRELQLLRQARERGMTTVAVVSDGQQLDEALTQGVDMLLVVPGLGTGVEDDQERRTVETGTLLQEAADRAASVERRLYLHPLYESTLASAVTLAHGVIRHPLPASVQSRP